MADGWLGCGNAGVGYLKKGFADGGLGVVEGGCLKNEGIGRCGAWKEGGSVRRCYRWIEGWDGRLDWVDERRRVKNEVRAELRWRWMGRGNM